MMSVLARIWEYDYKPSKWEKFLAHGEGASQGTPMVGVELEIVFHEEYDLACFRAEMQRAQKASPAFEKAVFLKRDGSLPEDRSVEVVFQPHHLGRLRGAVERVVSIADNVGACESHSDAGMHIHVSRPGLGLHAQGAILLFWNNLEDTELDLIAARRDGEYNRRQDEVLSNPFEALLDHPGHYYRVDARRSETLEVRVFSGFVDSGFVTSRANVVQMVYGYCKEYPLNGKNAANWRERYRLSSVLDWARARPEYRQAVDACC